MLKVSPEWCLSAVRAWSDWSGFVPSSKDWQRRDWRPGEPEHPCRVTVSGLWPSWAAFLAAAGLSPSPLPDRLAGRARLEALAPSPVSSRERERANRDERRQRPYADALAQLDSLADRVEAVERELERVGQSVRRVDYLRSRRDSRNIASQNH